MVRRTTGIAAFGAACGLTMAVLALPTAAQTSDAHYGPYAVTSWSLKKVRTGTGECTMVVNHGAMGLDAAGTRIVKERYGSGGVLLVEWTGGCNAEGLINGRGALYIDLDESGDYYSKRFIGTADRGVFNGPVSYNAFYDAEAEEYDELGPDQSVTFVNGCNNWAGARANSCDTGQAVRMRNQYLASRGTAAAPKPAPKLVVTPPAKPAGPVPVAVPPSQTGSLNNQQNDAAAAWLKADNEAKRLHAAEVAEFERKKAEFNRQQTEYERQQAEYARQQAEYKSALAAQQAEVARVEKHNADVVACNNGDRSRCPKK